MNLGWTTWLFFCIETKSTSIRKFLRNPASILSETGFSAVVTLMTTYKNQLNIDVLVYHVIFQLFLSHLRVPLRLLFCVLWAILPLRLTNTGLMETSLKLQVNHKQKTDRKLISSSRKKESLKSWLKYSFSSIDNILIIIFFKIYQYILSWLEILYIDI